MLIGAGAQEARTGPGLLTIELKELRRDASPAALFLRSRLKSGMTIQGSQLHVEGVKAREVKLLLNKFLHQKSIRGFRVVAPEAGVLEVREVRKPVARTAPRGNPPSPSISMPYYFPSSGKESALVPYGKRSRRK